MGLHQRYAEILDNKTLTLAAPIKDELRDELRKKFAKMMSALFKQKGANLDINIIASDEAQDFINTHTSVLDSSFQKVGMSDLMRQRLTRSNYIFSGLKTFHELNEAFPSLLDENGNKKTFERFLNDVLVDVTERREENVDIAAVIVHLRDRAIELALACHRQGEAMNESLSLLLVSLGGVLLQAVGDILKVWLELSIVCQFALQFTLAISILYPSFIYPFFLLSV